MANRRPDPYILRLRNGLTVACRGGNLDWAVLSGIILQNSYGRSLSHLKTSRPNPIVFDLGANIGLFSLLAAHAHQGAQVLAYEPAPPNLRMLQQNRSLNPSLADRIHIFSEAVGGSSRTAEFCYVENWPEASGLFYPEGKKYPVRIRAFAEVLQQIEGPIALVKMDIEGAEYEILDATPPEIWARIQALTIEVHPGHSGAMEPTAFLARMASFGFQIDPEPSPHCYYLYREGVRSST